MPSDTYVWGPQFSAVNLTDSAAQFAKFRGSVQKIFQILRLAAVSLFRVNCAERQLCHQIGDRANHWSSIKFR